MEHKCPWCDSFKTQNLNSLRVHCSKLHKRPSIDIYRALFTNGEDPKCECGCGQPTEFDTLQKGFNRFINSHNSRVVNGWGHNSAALAKSQATRRDMYKRGEIVTWTKGLTKETDERVASIGNKVSQRFEDNPEKRIVYSERMRTNRLSGTVPTLRGPDHSRWKGGTSTLQPLCRSHLYRAWTYPKMYAQGFKCQICSAAGPGLEVHHDAERFASILHKAIIELGEPGDDFEKKTQIAEWVTEYHLSNDVSGLVLCRKCHDEQHAKTFLRHA